MKSSARSAPILTHLRAGSKLVWIDSEELSVGVVR